MMIVVFPEPVTPTIGMKQLFETGKRFSRYSSASFVEAVRRVRSSGIIKK